MREIVVDANVLLRLILGDVPDQFLKAKDLFSNARDGKIRIFIYEITIFELDFIMEKYYKIAKKEVISRLVELVGTKYLKVESRDAFMKTFLAYEKSKNSFVDCFLVTKTKTEQRELFTFDKGIGDR